MANEATLVVETEPPIMFKCANGTGIEKGAILELGDAFTVSGAVGDQQIVGGIAAEEKIASDGKTKIAVYRGGIFKVQNHGGSTVGDIVGTGESSGAANDVMTNPAGTAAGAALGIALETATNDDTFLIELRPGSGAVET